MLFRMIFIFLLLPVNSFANAPIWKIDYAHSVLNFTATQNGSPSQGQFKIFDGEIKFDPAQLSTSSIKINVDMNSVSSAYKDIGDTLKMSDWFDVKNFPQAIYESNNIKNVGGKNYEAQGTLTIKGIKLPVTLNFVLDNYSDKAAHATGKTTLQRTQFKVGAGEWSQTDTVKDPVEVDFIIAATK